MPPRDLRVLIVRGTSMPVWIGVCLDAPVFVQAKQLEDVLPALEKALASLVRYCTGHGRDAFAPWPVPAEDVARYESARLLEHVLAAGPARLDAACRTTIIS